MTQVLRLTLVSHAMTAAMAAGRFPADEPLSEAGRRQVEAVTDPEFRGETRQVGGPERRTRQTALLLGLQATMEPRLADLDCGRWRGATLDDISPKELHVWQADPAAAPHGGESIVDLMRRVAAWLESLTANTLRTLAVTHPAVIRAAILLALDIPAKSFWRIDIAPLSCTVLHFRDQRWTLRLR